MDPVDNATEMVTLAVIILVLIMNTHRSLALLAEAYNNEADNVEDMAVVRFSTESARTAFAATMATLRHFIIFTVLAGLEEDLGFWVKPRSTTWFIRFLLHEYDDERWIQMFRMSKRTVLQLANILADDVKKQDTNYRLSVPVTVRIACTLFKLTHGINLLICSELFAVGRSTVCTFLRQVVHAVNIHLRGEMCWPFGDAVQEVAAAFKASSGLPGVMGAIDGTHFSIAKPCCGAKDYFYFKKGGYSINCQAVVDSNKKILDLYVGMPGSTNDSRMLRRSTLFARGQRQSLWDGDHSFQGFSPYLVGDAGYPLLPWLMVPHWQMGNLAVAEREFNRRLSRGRAVVEHAFALLKGIFCELSGKSNMHVAFMPDVVTCCAILHNMLLNQSVEDVALLHNIFHREGTSTACESSSDDDNGGDGSEGAAVLLDLEAATQKRQAIGGYLTLHRIMP